MPKCCVESCIDQAKSRGMCSKHYGEFYRFGEVKTDIVYFQDTDFPGCTGLVIYNAKYEIAAITYFTSSHRRAVNGRSWHITPKGYVETTTSRKTIGMHRIVMSATSKFEVDHINHNTLDNRDANLRLCNRSQNVANIRARNSESGYKGVSLNKESEFWHARISEKGTTLKLGVFETPEEAAWAYDVQAYRIHGEFACLNFPERLAELREIYAE